MSNPNYAHCNCQQSTAAGNIILILLLILVLHFCC